MLSESLLIALIYLLPLALYFVLFQLYFILAKRYNWVDRPNERSSHTKVTIVGAGVVFYFAFIFFELHEYLGSGKITAPCVWVGVTLLAVISFIDDRVHLPNKVRITSHFVASALMFWQLGVYENLAWYWIAILFIMVVGTMNAYNFMDGINGITGMYSLVTIGTIMYLLSPRFYFLGFYLVLALIVFLFFNFRKKAICFCGDVGSITIAYLIIFLLLSLIIFKTFDYMILLLVYGVDAVLTIIYRLRKGENIFKAHRSHVYQLLVHNAGWSHRSVSLLYAALQLLINIIFILSIDMGRDIRMSVFFGLIVTTGLLGIWARKKLQV